MEAVFYRKKVSDRNDQDYQPVGHLNVKIKACCELIKINSRVMIQQTPETTFMNQYLVPYLHESFMVDPSPNTVFRIVDGVEESGAIADYKLGYIKNKNESLFAFFVEVKRPGQTSKYQPEDDYTKLLIEMKDSLDKQVDLGFVDPFCFGLLMEGFVCTLYFMTIIEEGLYVPVTLKRFRLMQRIEDAVYVPAMVESFMFVKSELATTQQASKERDNTNPLKIFMNLPSVPIQLVIFESSSCLQLFCCTSFRDPLPL